MTDALEAAAQRLYGLLPAHVRVVDQAGGGALLAFLSALATGAVALDRETDRLLANMFVETADAIGLDNLARLVGAEHLVPLPAEARFSPRAFIANTVRYRRRKGTPGALEGLAADLGLPGAVVVEYYQRLARTAALIDPRPERPGTASLVDGDVGARAGTAFDLTARVADVRSIARAGGRYGVPNVGVHDVRLTAPGFPAPAGDSATRAQLAGVPVLLPWRVGSVAPAGYFQLSPFAEARLPLVNPDRRDTLGGGRMTGPARIDRLRRLPLARETEALRLAALQGLPAPSTSWFAAGQPFTLFVRRQGGGAAFVRVPPEQLLIANLEAVPTGAPRPDPTRHYEWSAASATGLKIKKGDAPIVAAFDPATGRAVFAKPKKAADEVVEARLAYGYGQGDAIGAGAHDRSAADVPADVRPDDFLRIVDVDGIGPAYVATLADALAAWAAEAHAARGFILLARCDAETLQPNYTVTMRGGTELHVVAAQWRPKRAVPGVVDAADRVGYIVRSGRSFAVRAHVHVVAGTMPAGSRPGALVLDGLALAGAVSVGDGALSTLWLRHVTSRPAAANSVELAAAAAGLAIKVERSILGRIALGMGGTGQLAVTRSILLDTDGDYAIQGGGFDVDLSDVTLLARATVRTLNATGTIFAQSVTVARRQTGCVRYSAIAAGSTTPRRYRCQPDLAIAARAKALGLEMLAPDDAAAVALGLVPVFLDTDGDEPTLGLLSPLCAPAIRAGGEGGKEMGAFAATGEPMRVANVTALFADYLPAALEGAILDDTRSRASCQRRIVP
ncbi:hypothetical protein [Sphingomonas nostoxanthinifaciens]|uniref:hypothetical protein n=1 Tax=Sphingomonas nostoxanthinifaciens TaxID=2872652 RepID=UPI001CC1C8B9|nr:hypothetical protein [Sphingomonas nostoxanthinifaciens]UAK23285.1 hypothetical protein K8P63_12835 [Sphingomonas nostoxanthinifaciens]